MESLLHYFTKVSKRSLYFWGGVFAFLLIGFLYWLLHWRYYEYTDDAYVEGNQVYITPLHPGFVTGIHTDDTFLVKKGQLLVELDKTDAKIALDQAKEDLAQTVRNVCQLFHQTFEYKAQIEIKKAEYLRAVEDFGHRAGVLMAGGVSLEDYEHAVAALRANFYSLRMTEIALDKVLAIVRGTSITTHPLVLSAADRLRNAWVQLYRCKIYSPVEGLAAQRRIQVGMHVDAGAPLLSVIPLDQIWINANFKETQLKHMQIGQRVRITSDLYGRDVIFHGKIVGLPGGAGNAFSLLPPQNLSGNWIKIVQRLPVRVAVEPEILKRYPLRVGLSMEAVVDLRKQTGELVPTSSENSPIYTTSIYEIEEKGDQELIDAILQENLDPTLESYAYTPLQMLTTHIPPHPMVHEK
jgi:membrane fusion protein (multidrug efflux system)